MYEFQFIRKTLQDWIERGRPLDFEAFSYLLISTKGSPNYIGGSSFRDWCAGIMHKGVYCYTRNYSTCISVSTDPEASWQEGCTRSSDYGDPMPCARPPSDAKLVPLEECPPEIQRKVIQDILPEIFDQIEKHSLAYCEAEEMKENEYQTKLKEERNKFLANWGCNDV